MTTVLLIRHAATDAIGHTMVGRLPGVELNAVGRAQLDPLVARLGSEKIDRVYSSPLERTRKTAAPVAERLGLEVRLAEELLEVDTGQWSGRTFAELAELPPWIRFDAYRAGTRPPNGEWIIETQARVVKFMLALAEQLPDQTLALFSHGDVIKSAICYFLGGSLNLLHRIEISPASCSAIQLRERDARVLYVNRVSE